MHRPGQVVGPGRCIESSLIEDRPVGAEQPERMHVSALVPKYPRRAPDQGGHRFEAALPHCCRPCRNRHKKHRFVGQGVRRRRRLDRADQHLGKWGTESMHLAFLVGDHDRAQQVGIVA